MKYLGHIWRGFWLPIGYTGVAVVAIALLACHGPTEAKRFIGQFYW